MKFMKKVAAVPIIFGLFAGLMLGSGEDSEFAKILIGFVGFVLLVYSGVVMTEDIDEILEETKLVCNVIKEKVKGIAHVK